MNTSLVSTISLTALLTLSACGSAADIGSASSGAPKASEGAGVAATPNVSAEWSPVLSIQGFVHGADGSPLSAVEICLQAGPEIALDIGNCATSATDGSFVLHGIPQEMLVTIAFKKAGYVPAIRAIRMETSDVELPSNENLLLPASSPPAFAGAPLDAKSGGLEFFVASGNGETSRASVWIMSYENPGDFEPVYFDAAGKVESGAQAGSSGAFVGLPTGQYAVTFYTDKGSCTPKGGIYGEPLEIYDLPGQTSLLVPVVEGHITMPVGVDCTP